MKNDEYIIFDTQPGGMGKNVAGTAVISNIREQYPEKKIIVISPYPDVFLHNPNVYRVYNSSALQYFYDDFIKDRNTLIFKQDPYNETSHIYEKSHLITTWSKLCRIEDKKIQIKPRIFLTNREILFIQNKLNIQYNDKICVIQSHGGADNLGYKYDWARDIPLCQAIQIARHMKSLGYRVFQIKREDQPIIEGCEYFTGSFREIACLISLSNKRIFIDSVCNHISAALGLTSLVLWIANKPSVFGYPCNINIMSNKNKQFRHSIASYLQKEDWTGQTLYQYPFDGEEVFDLNEILNLKYLNE